MGVWKNKAGPGADAVQGIASNRPTLLAPGIGPHPVVRFDGGDWLNAGTLRATPGPLAAFVVSRRTPGQTGGTAANTYPRLLSTSDGADGFDWQAPDWTIVSAYDGSGQPLAYGPDVRPLIVTNATHKIANLTIGRDAANGLSRLIGDVGEILVFTNRLNDAAIAAVQAYLATKWLDPTHDPRAHLPLVGAIRWDAWIGDDYGVGRAVHKALGPAHWHHRLPYFGYALSSTQVVVQSISPYEEDRQNAFAHAAGLDYWAFVMYGTNDPMTRFGIDLYLQSPWRDAIRFCMINQGQTPASWPAFQARMLDYFGMPNHVRVANGRPLFYLFNPASMVQPGYFASWADAKAAFDGLRAASLAAGHGNPYLVAMDFSAATANTYRQNLGFDAISAYALQGGHSHAPFATLAAYAQNWWTSARQTGAAVIPLAMVGWDRRPRVENPVPWEPWQEPGVGLDKYYAAPTPSEWTQHLRAAIGWVESHPASAPAHAALIYSWNEIDEGGWLLPTHVEGTARLAATRAALDVPTDRDTDGMDDLWEVWHLHSTTNSNGIADADGDGFSDRHEFLAGTDPNDPESLLAIRQLTIETTNTVSLSWASASNRTYAIIHTDALNTGQWWTNPTAIPATPPLNAATVRVEYTTGYIGILLNN